MVGATEVKSDYDHRDVGQENECCFFETFTTKNHCIHDTYDYSDRDQGLSELPDSIDMTLAGTS